MYHYLYHQSLKKSKYNTLVLDIDSRIHKLGLDGTKYRLGSYTSVPESVTQALRDQTNTIVVIGDDELFSQVINQICTQPNSKITIGYIPAFGESNITKSLGISLQGEAVQTLARRRVEDIRVGQVGDLYFIDSLSLYKLPITINHDHMYTTSFTHKKGLVTIHNLPDHSLPKDLILQSNPKDETLEIVFRIVPKGLFKGKTEPYVDSIFSAKHITIESSQNRAKTVEIDGYIKIKTPLTVGVRKEPLKIIVGKDRLFS